MDLEQLRAQARQTHADAEAIIAKAEQENEDGLLTDEQQKDFDAKMEKVEQINAAIDRRKKLDASKPADEAWDTHDRQGRKTGEGKIAAQPSKDADPMWGFQSEAEFFDAIKNAGLPGRGVDERLMPSAAAAGTYANEGVGQEGGFAVPPDISTSIQRLMLEEDAFLSMTDRNQVRGNSMRFPVDETTPWGTSGVRVYWEAEGAQARQTRPNLKYKELRLHKLLGLAPVTDELLEDSAAMAAYLRSQLGRSLRWKSNDALVNGSGAGQPLGIANANAKVQVTRNASNEVQAIDIGKMFARLKPGAQSTAVWMVHPDVWPELITMSVANQPIFTNPNQGITQTPNGTLMGRPVMVTQTAESLGTAGDVRLVDWADYITIEKAGGVRTASSMHLYFDAEQTAFRASYRMDGQPWLSAPIDQNKGSNKLSTIVELA